MPATIAVRHFRNEDSLAPIFKLFGLNQHNRVPENYTLAIKVRKEGVYYQFAVCSPKDQFSRKIGRELALQRLNDFPIILNTGDIITAFKEELPPGLLSSIGFAKYQQFTLEDISSNFIFSFANRRFKDIHNPTIEE